MISVKSQIDWPPEVFIGRTCIRHPTGEESGNYSTKAGDGRERYIPAASLVTDEMIEKAARAIMASAAIKWDSPIRAEALRHARSALKAVIR